MQIQMVGPPGFSTNIDPLMQAFEPESRGVPAPNKHNEAPEPPSLDQTSRRPPYASSLFSPSESQKKEILEST